MILEVETRTQVLSLLGFYFWPKALSQHSQGQRPWTWKNDVKHWPTANFNNIRGLNMAFGQILFSSGPR